MVGCSANVVGLVVVVEVAVVGYGSMALEVFAGGCWFWLGRRESEWRMNWAGRQDEGT